ncbi:Lon protease [Sulfidibacter corallicola]|uniref:Lon protease n=1 Tax=Sulfidibacter corallicola TaxID=2818388 RepID=A0A8A4TI97_SULCO|nr:endopeptidase La [Sulfidibacter corallicola]QTD49217.1 endopeptidase La [Sulfidibacter corallicola]
MSEQLDTKDEIHTYPLLALKNVVVFPETPKSLFFNRPQSLEAIKEAVTRKRPVLVVTMKSPDRDVKSRDDLHQMGVIGRIAKVQRLPNGAVQALLEPSQRASVLAVDLNGPFFTAKARPVSSRESADLELPQLVQALKHEVFNHLDMEKKHQQIQWNEELDRKDVPAGRFADAVAPMLNASLDELQDILETLDTRERVEKVYTLLYKEIQQRKFEKDLKARIEEQVGKRQKEYFLNEQMRAIQEEMGESPENAEFDAIAKAIEEAEMPEAVRETAEKELAKLRRIGLQSHEATPVRNYLDWLTSVPWSKATEDNLSVHHTEEILNEDHYGLDKPKERIIEYLAVSQAVGALKGPIICLSGPPGVGKTSFAKSIARSLGREFARISLGGVRDEAEIRGHRRTYIGAMPGKIIQTMKKVKTVNPVLLLDEIDKISNYFGGGPTAALLEVLDPEQNHTFMDHYLEVEYDLSKVLFICTANDLGTVPLPLRDRMEIIELSGYTELEKVHIANRYLIPKQMKENGLVDDQLQIPGKLLLEVIRGYTREAGVRGLDRTISKLCRKAVTDRLKSGKEKKIRLTRRKVQNYLGIAPFSHQKLEQENMPGMVTGLAWTSVGGETLSIEVQAMKGTGKLSLTGKLGDVMKESAQAALSYVRANANDLGIYGKSFKNMDIHIHVPAGGTPKDGPSAGIALAGGLVSALTGIPIHWNVGLTGEITLRGNVLPIGGLKEKLMAALRANLDKVLIPVQNEKDLAEVPAEIRDRLQIVTVKHVSEVFPVLLEHLPIPVKEPEGENSERQGAFVPDRIESGSSQPSGMD